MRADRSSQPTGQPTLPFDDMSDVPVSELSKEQQDGAVTIT